LQGDWEKTQAFPAEKVLWETKSPGGCPGPDGLFVAACQTVQADHVIVHLFVHFKHFEKGKFSGFENIANFGNLFKPRFTLFALE
jgi:hypothetical protein